MGNSLVSWHLRLRLSPLHLWFPPLRGSNSNINSHRRADRAARCSCWGLLATPSPQQPKRVASPHQRRLPRRRSPALTILCDTLPPKTNGNGSGAGGGTAGVLAMGAAAMTTTPLPLPPAALSCDYTTMKDTSPSSRGPAIKKGVKEAALTPLLTGVKMKTDAAVITIIQVRMAQRRAVDGLRNNSDSDHSAAPSQTALHFLLCPTTWPAAPPAATEGCWPPLVPPPPPPAALLAPAAPSAKRRCTSTVSPPPAPAPRPPPVPFPRRLLRTRRRMSASWPSHVRRRRLASAKTSFWRSLGHRCAAGWRRKRFVIGSARLIATAAGRCSGRRCRTI